jgi:hypothetical protein
MNTSTTNWSNVQLFLPNVDFTTPIQIQIKLAGKAIIGINSDNSSNFFHCKWGENPDALCRIKLEFLKLSCDLNQIKIGKWLTLEAPNAFGDVIKTTNDCETRLTHTAIAKEYMENTNQEISGVSGSQFFLLEFKGLTDSYSQYALIVGGNSKTFGCNPIHYSLFKNCLAETMKQYLQQELSEVIFCSDG